MILYIALAGAAGTILFCVFYLIMLFTGKSLKIPLIGMGAFFLIAVAGSALLLIGDKDGGPDTADKPSQSVESTEPGKETGTPPEETNGPEESADVQDWGTLDGVDVDPSLFDVTLTVPKDYVEGITQEELDASADEKGFKSAKLNDDGSVTYIMTKAQHKKMMDGVKEGIDKSLSEMSGSEEYPSIVKIEANDNYTKYKVYISAGEVGLSESLATMGLYIFSGTYHVFNGTEPDNVNIQFINEATGKVIEEANSKDVG